MRLWSIHPISVWEEIQTKGYYRCDPNKAELIYDDDVSLKAQYLWLVDKMKARVGDPPDDVQYPVWAWYIYDGVHKKPDLRRSGYEEPGTQCVCMEVEIPDNKVLLSDFDGWHFVLGNWYYMQGGSEEEFDHIMARLDQLPKDEKNEHIRKSWDKIFDIQEVESDWCPVGDYVQATFWELRAKDIRKVVLFRAR